MLPTTRYKYITMGMLSLGMLGFLGSCKSSKEKEDTPKMEKVYEELAPGTIQARVTLLETRIENGKTHAKLRLDEVESYGPSSPLADVNSEFWVELDELSIALIDELRSSEKEEQQKLLAILSHQMAVAGMETASPWRLVSLTK